MPAQNNFGNSSKSDLKFFVPLAVMQTQNSKGVKFFRGGNSKFAPVKFCVLTTSRRVQNFRPISEEIKNLVSIFEIAIGPYGNARYIYRCQKSENGVDG